jgi:hypothetical protein
MKDTITGFEEKKYLSKHQVISFRGRNIRIECVSGAIWITWPEGPDDILKSGQTLTISSTGKICIMAFSNALVRIWKKDRAPLSILQPSAKRKRWIPVGSES